MSPTKKDEAIQKFGAAVVEKHLAAMRLELVGVRQGTDIEAIHRMRVASRRLRATLPLFKGIFSSRQQKTWEKQIRQVTQALGAARDMDVQIESLGKILEGQADVRTIPGVKRVILRLSQQRAGLQAAVIKALDNLEASGALEPPSIFTPETANLEVIPSPYAYSLYLLADNAVRQKLEALLAFEPYVQQPEASKQLHAMRIAAKWLRYTLETFAPLYNNGCKPYLAAVKLTQELLGDIHDCDVWAAFLPDFAETEKKRILDFYGHTRPYLPLIPGLNFLGENRRQKRQASYTEFFQVWQEWSQKSLWQELVDTLTLPLSLANPAQLFPLLTWRPEQPVESPEQLN